MLRSALRMKGIHALVDTVAQFPPGHWARIEDGHIAVHEYYMGTTTQKCRKRMKPT